MSRGPGITGIATQQEQVTAELDELRETAVRKATSIRTAAQELSDQATSRADTEASATHAMATSELSRSRAEIADLRAAAAAEISATRDAAMAEADRVLGDAADHMHWAQDTVQSSCRPPRQNGCAARPMPSSTLPSGTPWPPANTLHHTRKE